MDKGVGVDFARVLIPEELLGEKGIGLGVYHHHISVELPEAFAREVYGRVAHDIGRRLHFEVILLQLKAFGKAPEWFFGVFEHQPRRRGEMVAGIAGVAYEGRHVRGGHGRRCHPIAYIGHIALLLLPAAT